MEKEVITSEKNPIIKHVKSLQLRKYRTKHRQFVIEGLRIVEECIVHQGDIDYILYDDEFGKTEGELALLGRLEGTFKTHRVEAKLFSKIAETENTQGIMAVVNYKEYALEDINLGEEGLIVVLDQIQDPGNMGTIIRTAEGAGVKAVLLAKGCVDPYNSKTIRSTMGAIFHLPIIQLESSHSWIEDLKKKDVRLVASALGTNKTYLDIDYTGRVAIVIGNEANGITEEVIKGSDEVVHIPIIGKIESLNASIAAGILIYKAVECRLK